MKDEAVRYLVQAAIVTHALNHEAADARVPEDLLGPYGGTARKSKGTKRHSTETESETS